MLFLNGQPFHPLKMDKAGDQGGSGGGAGGAGAGGKDDPSPGDKGKEKPPEGGDKGAEGDLPDDESKWTPEQTKSYIKKLRGENANYRKRAQASDEKVSGLEDRFGKLEKGLKNLTGAEEDDSESVEEKLARLEERELARDEQQAVQDMNQAVEETATALGVPAAGMDYFKFLIQQHAEQMNDDDVIPEEVLVELAKKATTQVGGSKGGSTGADGKVVKPNPEGKPSGVTAAQFAKMSIAERSALYQNNKDEYETLLAEVKEKKLLI